MEGPNQPVQPASLILGREASSSCLRCLLLLPRLDGVSVGAPARRSGVSVCSPKQETPPSAGAEDKHACFCRCSSAAFGIPSGQRERGRVGGALTFLWSISLIPHHTPPRSPGTGWIHQEIQAWRRSRRSPEERPADLLTFSSP